MNRRTLRDCLQLARACWRDKKHPEYGVGYYHFSFIVQKNKILGHGYNRSAHPLPQLGYPARGKRHSETEAFRRLKSLIDFRQPYEVVNIRLGLAGELRLAQPCDVCHNVLLFAGCQAVYFSTETEFRRLWLTEEYDLSGYSIVDAGDKFSAGRYSTNTETCKIVWAPSSLLRTPPQLCTI